MADKSDQQSKLVLGVALGVLCLGSLKYLQIVLYSEEKWFHFSIMAMMAFGSVQLHQFYLNQKQIDSKISDLKQRSNEISLSRQSSKEIEPTSPTLNQSG